MLLREKPVCFWLKRPGLNLISPHFTPGKWFGVLLQESRQRLFAATVSTDSGTNVFLQHFIRKNVRSAPLPCKNVCPPFMHKHTHVSQPSSWPRCFTFSASPRPYITRFSRDLPVPPGLRDPAHSQWLDQHFQFPENHNLPLPPTTTSERLPGACGGREGCSARLVGENKILPCRRRSGSTPAVLPAWGAVCSLLFGTFKHSQDLEATQVSADHGWIKMLRFTYATEYSSAIKKNDTLSFAATEMGLERVIVSEISQRKTNAM